MEKVSDYGWIGESQRSWYAVIGNPFCVSRYTLSKKLFLKSQVIKMIKAENRIEKKRFSKLFPDVEW